MYVVSMKITGQAEVVEEALAPMAHAFQKRCSMAWPPENTAKDETITIDAADDLVTAMHQYMFTVMMDDAQPQRPHLDGYSLDLYQAVAEAVDQWVEASPKHEHFTKFHRQKVEFFHTDTLRGAWLNMRKCQFLSAEGPCPEETRRQSPNLHEYLMAVHAWLRQIDLHFAYYYYYYWRTVMRPAMAESKAGRASSDLLGSTGISAPPPPLEPRDMLKHEMLTNEAFAKPFDQKAVRLCIRNRTAMEPCKKTDVIIAVAQELVDVGLLELVIESAGIQDDNARRKKKGRAVKTWQRRSLADVTSCADADQERKRLRVSKDCFS